MTSLVRSYTEELTGKPRISYEEFLALPEDLHAEWVDGEVVPMPSVGLAHQRAGRFLLRLFDRYFERWPNAELFYEPFQVRLGQDGPGRSPDITIVRNEHRDRVRNLYVDGPADLIIEIVSPGSRTTDRGQKYYEYERGGVPEYWIIDPDRRVAEFHRLGSRGVYESVAPDSDGYIASAVLPGLRFRVDWLWSEPPLADLLAALDEAGTR